MLGELGKMLSSWQSCFLRVRLSHSLSKIEADDSTWIPIRFFAEGCNSES